MWLIGCSLPLTRRHSSACGASSLSLLSCAESAQTLDAGSAATLPEPVTCDGCKALMLERALTALVLAETRSRLRVCKLELSMVSNGSVTQLQGAIFSCYGTVRGTGIQLQAW